VLGCDWVECGKRVGKKVGDLSQEKGTLRNVKKHFWHRCRGRQRRFRIDQI